MLEPKPSEFGMLSPILTRKELSAKPHEVSGTRCVVFAVLSCAELCFAVLCCAVLFFAVLCRVVLCCAVLCCVVLCCAVLCFVVLFSAVLCCVLLSCARLWNLTFEKSTGYRFLKAR
jgi:hypothetical protein